MSNDEIAEILELYADLCVLYDENPIRVKSYQAASFRISKMGERLQGKSIIELEAMEGVGKRMAKVVEEIGRRGVFADLEILLQKTPAGILDMLKISGIGPAKVKGLWHEAGIDDLETLKEACLENRIAGIKGFGAKTQEKILKQIFFLESIKQQFKWMQLEPIAMLWLNRLHADKWEEAEFTGAYRRACEVLKSIDFLIPTDDVSAFTHWLEQQSDLHIVKRSEQVLECMYEIIPIHFYLCRTAEKAWYWLHTSSTEKHWQSLGLNTESMLVPNEQALYLHSQKPYIIPEMREGLHEWDIMRRFPDFKPLDTTHLTGIFHNHSTWSDGKNTISEMAQACIDLGWHYLGMADHSKVATYANGLSDERLLAQLDEIDAWNQSHSNFTLFKGIECDILNDGNLDYSPEILSQLDYVVASIHSQLDMDEDKAMKRLIKAIENPHTTMLGHPTGRLLLWRQGYPINHLKIIDACAANQVIIEINANPYRLDIDWRWLYAMMDKGVMTSINPDAHTIDGIKDVFYGIMAARKGGLQAEFCFNTKPISEIKQELLRLKKVKLGI